MTALVDLDSLYAGCQEGSLGQPSHGEARTPFGGQRSQAEQNRQQNGRGSSHTGFVTDWGLIPVAGDPGGFPWSMNFLIPEPSVVMACVGEAGFLIMSR